jgi:hypothetical protein
VFFNLKTKFVIVIFVFNGQAFLLFFNEIILQGKWILNTVPEPTIATCPGQVIATDLVGEQHTNTAATVTGIK